MTDEASDRRQKKFRPDTYEGWGRLLWHLSERLVQELDAAKTDTHSPSEAFENCVSIFRDRATTVGIAADIVWVSADDQPFEVEDHRFNPFLKGRPSDNMERMYALQLSECGRQLLRLVAPLSLAINKCEDLYLSLDEDGLGKPTKNEIRTALATLRRCAKELKNAYPLKRSRKEVKNGIARALLAISEQGVLSYADLEALTGVPKQTLHDNGTLRKAIKVAKEQEHARTVSLVADQEVLPTDPDDLD